MTNQFNSQGPENMIVISHDRTIFGGPQVQSELVLGGYDILISVAHPIHLTINGVEVQRDYLAIVPPHVRHAVKNGDGVRSILVESESVSAEIMDDERFHSSAPRTRVWAERIEDGFQHWQTVTAGADIPSLDQFFFGERLPPRTLDNRIVHAVDMIRKGPDAPGSRTATIAEDVSLSPSRLRHLFREQVGVPIRRYRAWKRLRSSVQFALQEPNLLKLAMAAGYADASHMCHSMKHYFGEQPSFVCALWRRATVLQTPMSERDSLMGEAPDRTFARVSQD